MPSNPLRSAIDPLKTDWGPIIIWAFRLWVDDRSNWPRIVHETVQHYGQDRACSVIRGLAMTISALRQHACRVIRHHPDGFPALTPDEKALLAMIADVYVGCDPIERAHGLIACAGYSLLRTALYELAWALVCCDSPISQLAAAE